MVNRRVGVLVASENALPRRPMSPEPEGSKPLNGWMKDGAILAADRAVR